jgi:hypothetical protein
LTGRANNRSSARSNVFLSAILDTGSQTAPIRIRNISSRGALIDGSNLPAVGAKLLLVRGSLSARGQVAWRNNDQAGISFDEAVNTSAWVARAGHAGQQRVDDIVAALRRSDELLPNSQVGHEQSLAELSVTLDEVCERLGNIREVAAAGGEELIRLDALAQTLRRLCRGQE